MVDDDEFDGLSGSVCPDCGNVMGLLRRHGRSEYVCDECGVLSRAA